MTGGILQLVAKGPDNIYLIDNPQITLFKNVYRRHTNFSSYPKKIKINNINFNGSSGTKIEFDGDLLKELYLLVELPSIEMYYKKITKSQVLFILKKYEIDWDYNCDYELDEDGNLKKDLSGNIICIPSGEDRGNQLFTKNDLAVIVALINEKIAIFREEYEKLIELKNIVESTKPKFDKKYSYWAYLTALNNNTIAYDPLKLEENVQNNIFYYDSIDYIQDLLNYENGNGVKLIDLIINQTNSNNISEIDRELYEMIKIYYNYTKFYMFLENSQYVLYGYQDFLDLFYIKLVKHFTKQEYLTEELVKKFINLPDRFLEYSRPIDLIVINDLIITYVEDLKKFTEIFININDDNIRNTLANIIFIDEFGLFAILDIFTNLSQNNQIDLKEILKLDYSNILPLLDNIPTEDIKNIFYQYKILGTFLRRFISLTYQEKNEFLQILIKPEYTKIIELLYKDPNDIQNLIIKFGNEMRTLISYVLNILNINELILFLDFDILFYIIKDYSNELIIYTTEYIISFSTLDERLFFVKLYQYLFSFEVFFYLLPILENVSLTNKIMNDQQLFIDFKNLCNDLSDNQLILLINFIINFNYNAGNILLITTLLDNFNSSEMINYYKNNNTVFREIASKLLLLNNITFNNLINILSSFNLKLNSLLQGFELILYPILIDYFNNNNLNNFSLISNLSLSERNTLINIISIANNNIFNIIDIIKNNPILLSLISNPNIILFGSLYSNLINNNKIILENKVILLKNQISLIGTTQLKSLIELISNNNFADILKNTLYVSYINNFNNLYLSLTLSQKNIISSILNFNLSYISNILQLLNDINATFLLSISDTFILNVVLQVNGSIIENFLNNVEIMSLNDAINTLSITNQLIFNSNYLDVQTFVNSYLLLSNKQIIKDIFNNNEFINLAPLLPLLLGSNDFSLEKPSIDNTLLTLINNNLSVFNEILTLFNLISFSEKNQIVSLLGNTMSIILNIFDNNFIINFTNENNLLIKNLVDIIDSINLLTISNLFDLLNQNYFINNINIFAQTTINIINLFDSSINNLFVILINNSEIKQKIINIINNNITNDITTLFGLLNNELILFIQNNYNLLLSFLIPYSQLTFVSRTKIYMTLNTSSLNIILGIDNDLLIILIENASLIIDLLNFMMTLTVGERTLLLDTFEIFGLRIRNLLEIISILTTNITTSIILPENEYIKILMENFISVNDQSILIFMDILEKLLINDFNNPLDEIMTKFFKRTIESLVVLDSSGNKSFLNFILDNLVPLKEILALFIYYTSYGSNELLDVLDLLNNGLLQIFTIFSKLIIDNSEILNLLMNVFTDNNNLYNFYRLLDIFIYIQNNEIIDETLDIISQSIIFIVDRIEILINLFKILTTFNYSDKISFINFLTNQNIINLFKRLSYNFKNAFREVFINENFKDIFYLILTLQTQIKDIVLDNNLNILQKLIKVFEIYLRDNTILNNLNLESIYFFVSILLLSEPLNNENKFILDELYNSIQILISLEDNVKIFNIFDTGNYRIDQSYNNYEVKYLYDKISTFGFVSEQKDLYNIYDTSIIIDKYLKNLKKSIIDDNQINFIKNNLVDEVYANIVRNLVQFSNIVYIILNNIPQSNNHYLLGFYKIFNYNTKNDESTYLPNVFNKLDLISNQSIYLENNTNNTNSITNIDDKFTSIFNLSSYINDNPNIFLTYNNFIKDKLRLFIDSTVILYSNNNFSGYIGDIRLWDKLKYTTQLIFNNDLKILNDQLDFWNTYILSLPEGNKKDEIQKNIDKLLLEKDYINNIINDFKDISIMEFIPLYVSDDIRQNIDDLFYKEISDNLDNNIVIDNYKYIFDKFYNDFLNLSSIDLTELNNLKNDILENYKFYKSNYIIYYIYKIKKNFLDKVNDNDNKMLLSINKPENIYYIDLADYFYNDSLQINNIFGFIDPIFSDNTFINNFKEKLYLTQFVKENILFDFYGIKLPQNFYQDTLLSKSNQILIYQKDSYNEFITQNIIVDKIKRILSYYNVLFKERIEKNIIYLYDFEYDNIIDDNKITLYNLKNEIIHIITTKYSDLENEFLIEDFYGVKLSYPSLNILNKSKSIDDINGTINAIPIFDNGFYIADPKYSNNKYIKITIFEKQDVYNTTLDTKNTVETNLRLLFKFYNIAASETIKSFNNNTNINEYTIYIYGYIPLDDRPFDSIINDKYDTYNVPYYVLKKDIINVILFNKNILVDELKLYSEISKDNVKYDISKPTLNNLNDEYLDDNFIIRLNFGENNYNINTLYYLFTFILLFYSLRYYKFELPSGYTSIAEYFFNNPDPIIIIQNIRNIDNSKVKKYIFKKRVLELYKLLLSRLFNNKDFNINNYDIFSDNYLNNSIDSFFERSYTFKPADNVFEYSNNLKNYKIINTLKLSLDYINQNFILQNFNFENKVINVLNYELDRNNFFYYNNLIDNNIFTSSKNNFLLNEHNINISNINRNGSLIIYIDVLINNKYFEDYYYISFKNLIDNLISLFGFVISSDSTINDTSFNIDDEGKNIIIEANYNIKLLFNVYDYIYKYLYKFFNTAVGYNKDNQNTYTDLLNIVSWINDGNINSINNLNKTYLTNFKKNNLLNLVNGNINNDFNFNDNYLGYYSKIDLSKRENNTFKINFNNILDKYNENFYEFKNFILISNNNNISFENELKKNNLMYFKVNHNKGDTSINFNIGYNIFISLIKSYSSPLDIWSNIIDILNTNEINYNSIQMKLGSPTYEINTKLIFIENTLNNQKIIENYKITHSYNNDKTKIILLLSNIQNEMISFYDNHYNNPIYTTTKNQFLTDNKVGYIIFDTSVFFAYYFTINHSDKGFIDGSMEASNIFYFSKTSENTTNFDTINNNINQLLIITDLFNMSYDDVTYKNISKNTTQQINFNNLSGINYTLSITNNTNDFDLNWNTNNLNLDIDITQFFTYIKNLLDAQSITYTSFYDNYLLIQFDNSNYNTIINKLKNIHLNVIYNNTIKTIQLSINGNNINFDDIPLNLPYKFNIIKYITKSLLNDTYNLDDLCVEQLDNINTNTLISIVNISNLSIVDNLLNTNGVNYRNYPNNNLYFLYYSDNSLTLLFNSININNFCDFVYNDIINNRYILNVLISKENELINIFNSYDINYIKNPNLVIYEVYYIDLIKLKNKLSENGFYYIDIISNNQLEIIDDYNNYNKIFDFLTYFNKSEFPNIDKYIIDNVSVYKNNTPEYDYNNIIFISSIENLKNIFRNSFLDYIIEDNKFRIKFNDDINKADIFNIYNKINHLLWGYEKDFIIKYDTFIYPNCSKPNNIKIYKTEDNANIYDYLIYQIKNILNVNLLQYTEKFYYINNEDDINKSYYQFSIDIDNNEVTLETYFYELSKDIEIAKLYLEQSNNFKNNVFLSTTLNNPLMPSEFIILKNLLKYYQIIYYLPYYILYINKDLSDTQLKEIIDFIYNILIVDIIENYRRFDSYFYKDKKYIDYESYVSNNNTFYKIDSIRIKYDTNINTASMDAISSIYYNNVINMRINFNQLFSTILNSNYIAQNLGITLSTILKLFLNFIYSNGFSINQNNQNDIDNLTDYYKTRIFNNVLNIDNINKNLFYTSINQFNFLFNNYLKNKNVFKFKNSYVNKTQNYYNSFDITFQTFFDEIVNNKNIYYPINNDITQDIQIVFDEAFNEATNSNLITPKDLYIIFDNILYSFILIKNTKFLIEINKFVFDFYNSLNSSLVLENPNDNNYVNIPDSDSYNKNIKINSFISNIQNWFNDNLDDPNIKFVNDFILDTYSGDNKYKKWFGDFIRNYIVFYNYYNDLGLYSSLNYDLYNLLAFKNNDIDIFINDNDRVNLFNELLNLYHTYYININKYYSKLINETQFYLLMDDLFINVKKFINYFNPKDLSNIFNKIKPQFQYLFIFWFNDRLIYEFRIEYVFNGIFINELEKEPLSIKTWFMNFVLWYDLFLHNINNKKLNDNPNNNFNLNLLNNFNVKNLILKIYNDKDYTDQNKILLLELIKNELPFEYNFIINYYNIQNNSYENHLFNIDKWFNDLYLWIDTLYNTSFEINRKISNIYNYYNGSPNTLYFNNIIYRYQNKFINTFITNDFTNLYNIPQVKTIYNDFWYQTNFYAFLLNSILENYFYQIYDFNFIDYIDNEPINTQNNLLKIINLKISQKTSFLDYFSVKNSSTTYTYDFISYNQFDDTLNDPIKYPNSVKNTLFYKDYNEFFTFTDNNPVFRWIKYIGAELIQEIELEIGGQVISRLDSNLLRYLYTMYYDFNKIDGINKMIGHIPDLYNFSTNKDSYKLFIPIPFWFHKNPGLSLPLVALRYTDVFINLKIKSLDKISEFSKKALFKNTPLLNANLLCEYIYLENDERQKFSENKIEYLISNFQYNSDIIFNNKMLFDQSINIRMDFNNNIKYLIWEVFIESDNFLRDINIFNLLFPNNNNNNFKYFNPVKSIKILFNGRDRETNKEFSYYNLAQTYNNKFSFLNDNTCMYSFAINCNEFQPSGSANFSKLGDTTITLFLDQNNIDKNLINLINNKIIKIGIRVYANTYNILRVISGMAGVTFF